MLRETVHLMLDLIQLHARKQYDRQPPPVLLKIFQHLKPIPLRHVQIQQQQIHLALFQIPQNGMTITGLCNVVSILTEKFTKGVPL